MNKVFVLTILLISPYLFANNPAASLFSHNPNPVIPNASYYSVEGYSEQEKPDYFVNFYSSTGDLLVRKKQRGLLYQEDKQLDPNAPKPQPTAFAISYSKNIKMPAAKYDVLFFDKHGNKMNIFGPSSCYDGDWSLFQHFTADELKKNLSTEQGLKRKLHSSKFDLSKILTIPYENSYCNARMNFIESIANIPLSDNRDIYVDIDYFLRESENNLRIPRYCINNSQSSLSKKYYICLSNWINANLSKKFRSKEACYQDLKNILNRMKREIPLPELQVENELSKTIELWKKYLDERWYGRRWYGDGFSGKIFKALQKK